MSEFSRFKHMGGSPTPEDVARRIRDCRNVLKSVNGATICEGESLKTVDDFAARYSACMACYRATSNARGLVGHSEADLNEAFARIDGVLDACTATLGANAGRLP